MKKRNKFLFGILTPVTIAAVAALSSVTASIQQTNATYNQNTILESETNSLNVNQNSRATQFSSWNVTFNEDYDVSRVFVQADSTLSAFYPFQVSQGKFDIIKKFFANKYQNIFIGNMKAPSPNNFIVDEQNFTINNKEGWIDLRVTKKGYYDKNSSWISNGYMPTTIIRITNLKKANPTPTTFKIKQINGTPLKIQAYASDFVDELKSLYDSGNADEFYNFTKKWFNFDSSNFPFNNINSLNLNLSNVNNHQGSFLMTANYPSYFANDDYCTFINSTIGAKGDITTENKGLSNFKSYVIPFNSQPPASNNIGSTLFGDLYTKDFLDKLLTDANARKWVQQNVLALINNPKKGSTFNDIVLSNNKNDYVIDYDNGSLILAGSLNHLFVENDTISPSYNLKTNGIKIIITGFDAFVNTKILKNENFPIVDTSNNTLPTYKPSQVLANLKRDINKSWNETSYAKSFFLPLNLPNDVSNFKIKTLEGIADDKTGTLTITSLVFSGANVDGNVADLVVRTTADNTDNPFIYNFPVVQPKTTNLNQVGFIENNNDLFPYEIGTKFNDENIINQLKAIVKNQLIINEPNPSINNSEIDIKFLQANNRLGTIDTNVTIKRRLVDGTISNAPLSKKITIYGFKSLNETIINRNLNYPQDIYPSDIEKYLKDQNIMTDQEKILKFFDFYNLPKSSYDDNGNLKTGLLTNFKVNNPNNLDGTATISFTLSGGYFNNDTLATFVNNTLNFSLDFNLFKFAKPTKLNNVTLTGVDKWLTSDFVKGLQNNTTENVNILKSAIFNSCENPPEDINIDNYLNWITLGECSEVDDINKTFKIKVTINKYVDENGIVVDQPFTTTILVSGDFRSVENTRFKNYPVDNDAVVEVDNVSNVLASTWNSEEKIRNTIISSWATLIKGDIPPQLNINNDLIIKMNEIQINDVAGYIDVPVSLKTYYDGGQLVQNNQQGYVESTIIRITGFYTVADTTIPDTHERPYDINASTTLPSTLYSSLNVDQWKQIVIKNVLMGGTNDISVADVGDFKINRIDDKLGVISCDFYLKAYYRDGFIVREGNPQYNANAVKATNLFIGGFKKQTPSSLNQDLSYTLPNVDQILASDYFNKTPDPTWQTYFFNQGIASSVPTNANVATNIVLNKDNVKIDDKKGTITFNKVELNQYFAQAFGFDTTNKNFNIQKLPENQENFDNYPYPTSLTAPNINTDKLSPNTTITIHGFYPVKDGTTFIDDNVIDYNQSSPLVLDGYSTNYLVKLLSDDKPNEEYINNFKSFIFDNCIVGEKQGIDKDKDIKFTFGATDIENGTIEVNILLNKYWTVDANGAKLNDVTNGEKALTKTITFQKFAKYKSTKVANNQIISSEKLGANISSYDADELSKIIKNQNDSNFKPITSAIKGGIIEKCLSDNINAPVGNINNIKNIKVISTNLQKGEIEISYQLQNIWDITDQNFDGKNPQSNDKTYNITITNLKKLQETSIRSPLDINDWFLRSETYEKFKVRDNKITANNFLTSGYNFDNANLNFENAIKTLFEQNKKGILTPYSNDVAIVDSSISGTISDDNPNQIIVKLKLSNALYFENDELKKGEKEISFILTGFYPIPTGPTKIKKRLRYPLSGDLYDYVWQNKIYSQDFEKQILIEKNEQAIKKLSNFIFDNCLDQSSNLNGINKDSSFAFELYPNSQTNSFTGELYIRFWLKDYNDKNGKLVRNSSYDEAKTNNMFFDIIITNFPEKENELKSPTIPLPESTRISIKQNLVIVGINADGSKIENTHLPSLTVKELTSNLADDTNENTKLFKAWIMQNLYTGNLQDIVNNKIEDANNVIISDWSANYQTGEITVTTMLKNYYTANGISENGCIAKNICIYDFKQINSTKLTNLTLDLVNEIKYPLASDVVSNQTSTPILSTINSWVNLDQDYLEVFNEIKSSRVSDFVNKANANNAFKQKVFKYIKQWIVKNKSIVFSSLPDSMSDEELLNSIVIDSNSPWLVNNESGVLTVFFSLNKYLKDDGSIAQVPESNPLPCQISFNGFQMKGVATNLQSNFSISVTQSNSLPYFIAKNNSGIDYSNLTSNQLIRSNGRLSLYDENVIRRMILSAPINDEIASYNSLISGNINGGINSLDNISIDSVQALSTQGILIVKYHLLRAWTTTDVDAPTRDDLSGQLILVNFKQVNSSLQISEKISPFIYVGVGLGLFIILFLILFIIFYRKRRDIEYQQ